MSVESSTAKGVFMDGDNASYDRNAKKLQDEYDLVLTPDMEKELTEMGSLAEGIAERARIDGEIKGKESTIIATIRNLMETLNLTAQQAMDAMKIPVEEQSKYAALI